MGVTHSIVRTAQADIAVAQTTGGGLPVLLIHGNSSGKDVFAGLMAGPLGTRYRMIAPDLPGHGASGDAADVAAYSVPGYAQTMREVLAALDVAAPAVLGWSLGGHVGIELLQRRPAPRGLMIVGAPPFRPGAVGLMRAFRTRPDLLLAIKARLSPAQIARFARVFLGPAATPAMVGLVGRTDPRARPQLFGSLIRGVGADQKRLVETSAVPLAVVNGAAEPFARLSYVHALAYAHLWQGRCQAVHGAGHAPFLDDPPAFEALLARFLADVEA
ncbi:MAG TPA: alpha/beta hydrolase [Xanthobacteraceae bacterium]|nr:alpha/beta hydrolase [Xanthobacteraceae bacterium]